MLDKDVIPDELTTLDDDNLLQTMTKECIYSCNGKRMTDKISKVIHNKETFQKALKLVKMWAKRRCIYGSSLGFLGGVSWSILVARICLFCPNKGVADILYSFFKVL